MKRFFMVFMAVFCLIMTPFSAYANEKSGVAFDEKLQGGNGITIINEQTNEVISITDYEVEEIVKDNGDIDKTIIADVCLEQPKSRNSVTDSGVTVRITFNVSVAQSGTKYRMTGFKVTYTPLDRAFTISNRHVKTVDYGPNQYVNPSNYIYDYYPTSNSYSKSYSNQVWVDSSVTPGFVGGYAECTISRGASKWSLVCRDMIVYNDIA